MDQYPTPEKSPENIREVSLSEKEYADLYDLDDREDDQSLTRDAWMEANGLSYGDKVAITIGDREVGVYVTDKHDFFTRDKAATLELRDSLNAASRIMGEPYAPSEVAHTADINPPIETNTPVEQEDSPEALRIEAAEDMGEVAVDEFVEDPQASEVAPYAPEKLTGEALTAALESAHYQFDLRENYAREELSENASMHLSTIAEGAGSLGLIGNIVSGAEELKARMSSAYTNYVDSMNELRARGGIRDFNPKQPFMSQFDQIQTEIIGIRTGLMRASEHSVVDVLRSADAIKARAEEVTAEIEKNEDNFKDVLKEIARRSDDEEKVESSAKDSSALRTKITALDTPTKDVRKAAKEVEGLLDTQYDSVNKLLGNLDEIREAIRFDRDFNPQLLNDVYTTLGALGSEAQLTLLTQKQTGLLAAVNQLETAVRAVSTR